MSNARRFARLSVLACCCKCWNAEILPIFVLEMTTFALNCLFPILTRWQFSAYLKGDPNVCAFKEAIGVTISDKILVGWKMLFSVAFPSSFYICIYKRFSAARWFIYCDGWFRKMLPNDVVKLAGVQTRHMGILSVHMFFRRWTQIVLWHASKFTITRPNKDFRHWLNVWNISQWLL